VYKRDYTFRMNVMEEIMPEIVLKFISKTNSMYKRNYLFRMNMIVEIRSCIEILANDIKIYGNLSVFVPQLIRNYKKRSSTVKTADTSAYYRPTPQNTIFSI